MQRSHTYDNFVVVDGPKSESSPTVPVQMIRFQRVCGGDYEIMTLEKAIETVSREPDINILQPSFYYKKSRAKAKAESTQYIDIDTSIPSDEFHVSGMSILMIIYVICYII